ncbi:MAG: hypothetical protein CVU84_07145 [Firmicutes bacterium HGW-Firmicutes-1]|jgi:hypothetical protein|nr:MAG: hypothetical protein CVU84_07145 [Firmicutes bacterium HGW-Firmicutes-1]
MKAQTDTKYNHISHRIVKIASIAVMLITILYLLKDIWLGNGYVIFSDLDYGIYDHKYIQRVFGIFNEGFSSMNFFNLSRLIFILPFYLLSLVFGGWIPHLLIKSIIVGVILISAAGMYKLTDLLLKGHFGQFRSAYHYFGLIVPAIFYATNPWVIFRIQHIFLLPGYAVYPWVLYYFIQLFRQTTDTPIYTEKKILIPITKKQIVLTGDQLQDIIISIKMSLFIAIGSAAIHYFFFFVGTILFLSIIVLVHNIHISKNAKNNIKIWFGRHLMLWGMTLVVCSYWFVPYVLSTLFLNIEPGNVNVIDTLDMFSRYSSLKNIVYLISYWWPMFDFGYYLDSMFWISGGILLFFIINITLYRFSKHFYISLFTVTTLGVIALATGVNSHYLADLNVFVVTKIPIVGHIFRDPNKLVGVMAAYFAILLGFSVDRNIFLLRREGYGRFFQICFVFTLLGIIFLYIRPFEKVFVQGFYKTVEVPTQYQMVNDNHKDTEGKVLWLPAMDNMVLSNGVANYSWNTISNSDEPIGYYKTVGDFHFYSSTKNGIFQNEGNIGLVSYMYSFVQQLLDKTGAQNFGSLVAFMGFDEVAFHNDVLGQEQRQAFNKAVLDEQEDLAPYYEDSLFTLYDVPEGPTTSATKTKKSLILSKGLYPFLYMLDDQELLDVYPNNTALIWEQGAMQPFTSSEQDILLGDNSLDFILPAIGKSYQLDFFNKVNSADPNMGWAKTKANTPDWSWLIKINNLKKVDFEYDFGEGFIYTYTENRLKVPAFKINELASKRMLSIKDIVGDFFKSNNDDVLKLTVFPNVEKGDVENILYGETMTVSNGNNLWQVASSKLMSLNNLSGSFISVDALVSGVNAGDLHFKIHFYNEYDEELNVAYVSRGSESANYKKSKLICNTYVPLEAKKMKIDIINSSSTTKKSFFWIHDFNMYSLTGYQELNTLTADMNAEKYGDYHVYTRVFKSTSGGSIIFSDGITDKSIVLESNINGFEWLDLGVMTLDEKGLTLTPSDGLTVINSVVAIPTSQHDALFKQARSNLTGQQVDYSLACLDYEIIEDTPVYGLNDQILFSNSITGDLQFINNGVMRKQIDILTKDKYVFSITGDLSNAASVRFIDEKGSINTLTSSDITSINNRSFENSIFKTQQVVNEYYLNTENEQAMLPELKRYSFKPIILEPGHYTIEIDVNTEINNEAYIDQLHVLLEDEITIPMEMFDNDQYLLTVAASINNQYNIQQTVQGNVNTFVNEQSKSKLWMIYTFNQIKVKKGDMILFRTKANSEGLIDLHSKIFWMDTNKTLKETTYVEYFPKNEEYYTLVEAPCNGYLQPAFFARSDGESQGYFEVSEGQCFNIMDFSKIEGTTLIPETIGVNSVYNQDSSYVVYNEAYNPLWRLKGDNKQAPIVINFFNNGYLAADEAKYGLEFELVPMFYILYYVFIVFSFAGIVVYMLIIFNCRRHKL